MTELTSTLTLEDIEDLNEGLAAVRDARKRAGKGG